MRGRGKGRVARRNRGRRRRVQVVCTLQVWSVALCSNERRLVTVSGDREMRIFQVQSHGVEVRATYAS